MFGLSILQAPWRETNTVSSSTSTWVSYGPIWTVPNVTYGESHLLWLPLLGTWIAIWVIYAGLFFLFKSKRSSL